MKKKSGDPQAKNQVCSDWDQITRCLDEFPLPKSTMNDEVGLVGETWVFRGLKCKSYELQPAIEREITGWDWATLEKLVSTEFKARARMHMSAPLVPEHEFTWLAQMQHYAIPTRLLDFTYSPYVALYFSIRNGRRNGQEQCQTTSVRLWAVNAGAVNERFRQVVLGRTPAVINPWKPEELDTNREMMTRMTEGVHELIEKLFSARGNDREKLRRNGCVCAASPPSFNPRLVSQQGLFLLNLAEELSFQKSLITMMEPFEREWCKTIDIPFDLDLISKIEEHLFQMNIHEQSLFPDMEGLAGLIRQRIRLNWTAV